MNRLYTPGPWEVKGSGKGADYAFHIEPCIARVSGLGRIPSANAQLIAAAPELLEAAERLLAVIDNMTSDEFAQGGERLEREALRLIIARAMS